MKRPLLPLLAALAALVAACSGHDAEVLGDDGDNPLVVEGWIDNGGRAVVLLTSAITPDAAGGDLADAVIRWGRVTLSDGEKSVVLTGAPDRRYLPPYIYYSDAISGVAGRTYRLTAEYHGRSVSAVCTMPAPTPVDSVVFSRLSPTDTLYEAVLHFTAPADCPAYYHLSSCLQGVDKRYYPAMLGTIEATVPGEHLSLPVFRGKHMGDTLDFVPRWPSGGRMGVRFERVTREVYDFWLLYNKVSLMGGSQLIGTQQSLEGNIAGGLGVFSAQGTTTVVRTVP